MHHSICDWKHREYGIDAYIAFHPKVVNFYYVTHLVADGAVTFLAYHFGNDFPWFLTNTFLFI